jgi:glycosyltransferase involved in cell wall biosynthesis
VVINNLQARGRRLGLDIFGEARERFPLDLVGIGWEQVGGIGEFSHVDLLSFMKDYRFFFNPIRYTSLGLAVCEAMMIGLPILGLATTEMVMAVKNGINGFVETDRFKLYQHMSRLLADPSEARCLSKGARQIASENFHIDRFRRDWNRAIDEVTGRHRSPVSQLTSSSKVAHASLNDQ